MSGKTIVESAERVAPSAPGVERAVPPSAPAQPSAAEADRIERVAAELTHRLHADGFIVTIDGEVESAGVADCLKLSVKTLRNWRAEAEDLGPPSRTVRGNAWYSIRGLARWIAEEQRAGRRVPSLPSISRPRTVWP